MNAEIKALFEKEAARIAAENEARLKAQREEEARVAAENKARLMAKAEEEARLKAEAEEAAAKIAAEIEAKVKAEEQARTEARFREQVAKDVIIAAARAVEIEDQRLINGKRTSVVQCFFCKFDVITYFVHNCHRNETSINPSN